MGAEEAIRPADTDQEQDKKVISEAQMILDNWVRELIQWHFSQSTGTPFWLEFREREGWDPRVEVQGFDDLAQFGLFNDAWMRETPINNWVPNAYAGRPYHIFETGGTTGPPKQRVNWNDYQEDYEQFSKTLDTGSFPIGGNWLMLGPTGPRRLRLAIEHLANLRGGSCFHVDLDPRWVVMLLRKGRSEIAREYMDHVLDQGVTILENRPISCLFTTPKLLEALGERLSLRNMGVQGVLCGGTSISPQVHRFLIEEVLEGITFVPVYGNTLMGLAVSKPLSSQDNYSITYYPPQPRAVLRVVEPDTLRTVEYDQRGRVQLTTLTKEFFLPNFLERDEAIRAEPVPNFPWDGIRDVRPFTELSTATIEGVY